MKRTSNVFVSVNPNSPKKRRQKKPTSHGQVLNFGTADMGPAALNSLQPAHIPDENQPNVILGSPWTPLPNFRLWDSSKQTYSNHSDLSTPSPSVTSAPSSLDVFASDTTKSLPVQLKLRDTANTLGRTLETSRLHIYDPSSVTPQNVWRDCKREVLKMISDASRSPLDLISDLLDPSQVEHEHYRSRWFSSAWHSKLSDLLDSIFAHPKGRELVLRWMQPHALESICLTVASEMDLVTKELSLPSVEYVCECFQAHS